MLTLKKEDFKEIKPIHFESCRQIIANHNGECDYVDCIQMCPFYEGNSSQGENYEGCFDKYPDLVKAAKEFLRFEKEMKK